MSDTDVSFNRIMKHLRRSKLKWKGKVAPNAREEQWVVGNS